MLFDEGVKENPNDFYNRERELELFRKGIVEGRRLILVLGIRRIGKSSLVKVALNTLKIPYAYVDVRSIYREYKYIPSYAIGLLIEDILKTIIKKYKWKQIIEYLKSIKEVSIMGLQVKLNAKPSHLPYTLTKIFNTLNEWAKDNSQRIVLVLDEAQYLRFSKINFRSIIAYIYDNLQNLTLVLTGSEVGLLHDFLKINDPQSELYGRYTYEITLTRLSISQSIEFLIRGFREYGIEPPREIIEEAANTFNGIIGWLVYFGRTCIDKGLTREAINETLIKGSALVKEELSELYNRSKRYKYVLEAIANGLNTWSKIKRYLLAKELKPIYDSALHEILLMLQKMGLIEKRLSPQGDIIYAITDPVIEYTVKQGLI